MTDLLIEAIDLLPVEKRAEARHQYETLKQNVLKNHAVVMELCWQRNFFADRAAQKAFEKD